MSREYDVVVYGTVCLDGVWRVREWPQPGGYADVLEERKVIGGEAANTAIALVKWGVKVALVGHALGDDEEGRLLRELFARDMPEIDLRWVQTIPGAETPYCLCIATPDGNRTMIGRGFTRVKAAQLDPELARSASLFTMEPNAWEAGLHACRVAADAGMTIMPMDYSGVAEVNRVASLVVTSTDHVGANKTVEELERHATGIRDIYGPTTIVTRGQSGCIVAEQGADPGIAKRMPAYVAPEMIDSTGAGDVFRAGLIYGKLNGWSLERTVPFASAAAALNCGAMGGWCGVRAREDIETFLRIAPFHTDCSSDRQANLS